MQSYFGYFCDKNVIRTLAIMAYICVSCRFQEWMIRRECGENCRNFWSSTKRIFPKNRRIDHSIFSIITVACDILQVHSWGSVWYLLHNHQFLFHTEHVRGVSEYYAVVTCEIKLFQPSSMFDWNNFISARENLPEIISKSHCCSWIFSKVFGVAEKILK